MKEIKISVIVPVYNTEKYLEKCIDSILNQSLRDFELICVDDGSTDNSSAILEYYSDKDERVQIVHQENSNAGVARNNGLARAKGKYLLFLDSDDWFELDFFKKMYLQVERHNADICICDAYRYSEDKAKRVGKSSFIYRKRFPKRLPFSYKDAPKEIFSLTTPAVWKMLFARKFVLEKELCFQDVQRTNDMYFTLLALVKADRITKIDDKLVNYRVRSRGNLQSHNDETPLDFYEALKQIKAELIKMEVYEELRQAFADMAFNICTYNMSSLKNKESFIRVATRFKEEGMELFGISEFKPEVFYSYIPQNRKYIRRSLQELIDEFPEAEVPRINSIKDRRSYGDGNCKVSVIIPVYNSADYLRECIDSVLAQSLKDLEIICINDGSTDDSLKILEEYFECDQRIVLIDKNNAGIGHTRNLGMKNAKGKYMYFLDSDDYIAETALQELYDLAEKDKLDHVIFNLQVIVDENFKNEDFVQRMTEYYSRTGTHLGPMRGIDLFRRLIENSEYLPSVSTQFYRSDFLKSRMISFEEGILHEDELFSFIVYLKSERSEYLDKVLFYRRLREESIMTVPKTVEHCRGYFVCYVEICKFAGTYKGPAREKAVINKNAVRIYNTLKQIYRSFDSETRKKVDFGQGIIEETVKSRLKAEMKNSKLKNSKSYRLGKRIMAPFVRAKKIVKRS